MEQKLNVCLMNDSFPPAIDGVANAVVNYAGELTRAGDRAAVVTPYYPDAHDEAFSFPVLRYPSLDTTAMVGYRAGLPLSPELMGEAEHCGFNILHSHCPIASTLLGRVIRERCGAPLIFTYHTKFDIDIAHAIRGKLLQESAIKVLVDNISACDEVWVVSRGAGENLRSLGYEGEYLVMPNGVDFPRGRVSEEAAHAVSEGYDLPEGVPVFLFVGRMMWYKGLRVILDALNTLRAAGTDFRMVFIGGGGEMEEVRDYAEALSLTDRVFFTGPICDREQIRAWYCRADAFLFPSTFDTNGLVVREAAACALPSVLIRGSCAAEDIDDGDTGFLIEESADSMAEILSSLCAAPERMKSVGKRAQERIYLSWEDAVRNARRRYQTVLANYERGEYPSQPKPENMMLGGLAEALDSLNEARERRMEMERRVKETAQEIADFAEERELDILHDKRELELMLRLERERIRDRIDDAWEKIDRFL